MSETEEQISEDQLKVFVGERIRIARKAMNISQEMLGSKLGKHQNAVSEYEKGERAVSTHTLYLLAEALQVPISYFFPTGKEDYKFAEEDRKLLSELILLSDTARNYVVSFIEYSLRQQQQWWFMIRHTSSTPDVLWERSISQFEQDTTDKLLALQQLQNFSDEHRRKVSHDLIDPLNVVVGFTSILLEGFGVEKLDSRARMMIDRIATSANQMLKIIHETILASSFDPTLFRYSSASLNGTHDNQNNKSGKSEDND